MEQTIFYTPEDVQAHQNLSDFLQLQDLDVVREVFDKASHTMMLYCTHRWFVGICPDCGRLSNQMAEFASQHRVVDAPIRGARTLLLFDSCQLHCSHCRSAFPIVVRDVLPDHRVTVRLFTELGQAKSRDLATLAMMCGLSIEQVQALANAARQQPIIKGPISVTRLAIHQINDPRGRYDYLLVMVDSEKGLILDILPDETKRNVAQWLSYPPAEVDLSALQRVATGQYEKAVRAVYPHVIEENQSENPISVERIEQSIVQNKSLYHARSARSSSDSPQAPPSFRAHAAREEEESDGFQSGVAFLIAIVTLIGAIIAWQGTLVADNAGDADFAALNATLNIEETLTLNNTEWLRHYRAYSEYKRHDNVQSLLANSPSANLALAEAKNLATTNQIFFPDRYLNRDGTYESTRELAEKWAQAEQVIDLDPQPHVEEAQQLRQQTNRLVALFIPLAISLFFYTVAEGLHPSRQLLRVTMGVGGTLFLIFTIGATATVLFS